MNFKDDTENHLLGESYDEGHDSDVESRLYAEIYYSNSIIGDENSSINSATNNVLPDGTTNHPNKLKNNINNSQIQRKSNDMRNAPNIANEKVFTNLEKNVRNNTSLNTSGTLGVNRESNLGEQSNNKTNLKRPPRNNSNIDRCNKKMRTNITENNINDSSTQENTTNSINPKKAEDYEQNTIINPYNKNTLNSSQEGLKLLSPEFINILFGKTKNKKKFDKPVKKKNNKSNVNDKILERNNFNESSNENNLRPTHTAFINAAESKVQQEDSIKESVENRSQQNTAKRFENALNSLGDAETIIDISSESSEDSIEDNSKYKTSVATDKKLEKKGSKLDNVNSEDSTSDSEESIFEVPIAPKPAPPVIELKDSESESSSESEAESFSNSSLHDSSMTQVNSIPEDGRKSLNSIMNSNDDVYCIDSEDDESNNITLNCTEIQKGASSLSEIKKLNILPSNSKECLAETSNKAQSTLTEKEGLHDNNEQNVEFSHKQQNTEIVANDNKELDTVNLKQHSKSRSNSMRRMISDENYFFQPMTNKMKSFYNDSWGGENFDLNKLKSKMSNDPNKWLILNDDMVLSFSKRKRYFGIVCNRCNKDGHRQNQCPEPQKVPICHMCGIPGHFETRCPYKNCLTCGTRLTMYRKTCEKCQKMSCSRCNSRGHIETSCPDLWRRYHQTINSLDVVPPNNLKNVMKPQYDLYCCNCAKKGHDSDSCRKLRWSQHFPNPSYVMSYSGPPYYDENFDKWQNINKMYDNSLKLHVASSRTSNQELNRNKRSNIQTRQDFSTNDVSQLEQRIIFEIISKNVELKTRKNFILKLGTLKSDFSNNTESWNKLSEFLNSIALHTQADFVLVQKNGQYKLHTNCAHKYSEELTKLIQQYASRNEFQRAQMYLNCERDPRKIEHHLAQKNKELKELNEDPIQLYDEARSITQIITSGSANNATNITKFEKLMLLQKKLIMTLYKGGFADDSHKQLRSLTKKINNCGTKFSKKKKRETSVTLSLKLFFQYLYYYNKIFTPYDPKNLAKFIDRYKQNLVLRKKLMNNPVMFPNICNTHQKVSQSDKASVTDHSELASSSEIPPLLPSYSSNNSCLSKTKDSIFKSIEFNDQLNRTYLDSIKCNKPNRKLRLQSKFDNFIKNTKKLLSQAYKLNAPNLQSHIETLQKKMENEIYVREKDVKHLKILVKEELKRQQQNWR